jgi:hypothetical protein
MRPGLPDTIATQIAEIFSTDIDFHRDLRKGDRFSVVYEVFYDRGEPVKSGRVLAAEFVNQGKAYTAVYFNYAENEGGYYTADGKNLRKQFLRSPLEFSRITSGFSTARFHPVLQTWRAHKGHRLRRAHRHARESNRGRRRRHRGAPGRLRQRRGSAPPIQVHDLVWPSVRHHQGAAQRQARDAGRSHRFRRRDRHGDRARTCITNSASTTCTRTRCALRCRQPCRSRPK